MDAPRNRFLVLGAVLSGLAALLHVAVIFGGPDWYRFFGAGEQLAQLDAAGSPVPALVTSGIAAVLGLWAAYALSGAGVIRRLPLLRTGLVTITAIYLVRGLLLVPLLFSAPGPTAFDVWSSLICLGYGLVHLVGVAGVWRRLSAQDGRAITAEVAP